MRAQICRSRCRRSRRGVSSSYEEEDHPGRPFTRVHFLFPRPFVFAKLLHFNERGEKKEPRRGETKCARLRQRDLALERDGLAAGTGKQVSFLNREERGHDNEPRGFQPFFT